MRRARARPRDCGVSGGAAVSCAGSKRNGDRRGAEAKQDSGAHRGGDCSVGESQDIASDARPGLVLRDAQLANIAIYAIGPSSSTADLRFGAKPPNRGFKYPPGVFSGPTRPGAIQIPGNGGPPGGTLDLMLAAMWLISRGTNEINNHQLAMAAAATGGVHYRALRDRTVRTALDQIGGGRHAQYIVSYAPTGERSAGFHTIQVTVARPDLTMRTRLGYFVAGAGDESVHASPNPGP
jgi:hypothetical protein